MSIAVAESRNSDSAFPWLSQTLVPAGPFLPERPRSVHGAPISSVPNAGALTPNIGHRTTCSFATSRTARYVLLHYADEAQVGTVQASNRILAVVTIDIVPLKEGVAQQT